MSELNIDTADRATLEQVANDLGIQFQANTKDDTLRKRIKEQLGEPDDGDGGTAAGQPGPSPASAPGEAKRYRIIVATHDQDNQPVQVFVNGKSYVIERGEEVTVPASVVEVLKNAVQHHYDPHTMKESKVLAYPFNVVGEA